MNQITFMKKKKIIIKKSRKYVFVLSKECIFDYCSYASAIII